MLAGGGGMLGALMDHDPNKRSDSRYRARATVERGKEGRSAMENKGRSD